MGEIEKTQALSLETLAQLINIEHRAFIGSATKTLEHGIRAGELLAQAKSQCQHGGWLYWLGENFVGSVRTAQSYMQLYNNRDELRAKAQDSAHLTIDAALRSIATPKPSEATTPAKIEREEVAEAELPPKLGAIGQLMQTPEGRAGLAEANHEYEEEGLYLKIHSKINDLFWMVRHMPPEVAAKREFAHHAGDIARDVVLEKRRSRPIFQVEEAEALREWLGGYVQSLKDAEARLYEHSYEEARDKEGRPMMMLCPDCEGTGLVPVVQPRRASR